ncbi:phage tail tape measure protein [Blastopirellula marina]|uniref:Phage tail tape measure protein n=1 Tax=Blastopirellula marina TaxID=124 RepID=A0A2S8F5F4_9BACT|nr:MULTISPECIES: phage tail tape measure protein [Pirellulaceae]PQO27389.1 phage tail tape measure protein [Blastopirellula marina]RCS47926.1 phage tail tape measure protein [Bremerella cremea]
MTDKITQEIGIDATKALEALAKLDAGFQTFEKRLDSVYQRMSLFNKNAGRTVSAMKNVANGSKAVGAAFKRDIPQATQAVERLTVSWGLMARIVTTQLIVRALSQMRRTFEETGEAAVRFQRQVALIRTIDNSGASFDKLATSVRNLSDSFNVSLDDAGAGVYQALSNQVGNLGESLTFTAKAAQFSKATNSSLADSVDLLSAAIIGYGLSVDDTDRVSSIFFSAIDKGRITASELANSFGRVNTIAADLGVSLEETASTLAAISVRGTKTSEALTQFRATLTALQKPSDAMEATLKGLGFSSAQTAIQTLGLSGTLQALKDKTGGSSEALAKLFPNVRALSGVSSLASDEFDTLIKNTQAMTQAARDFSQEKFLQATATDAERLTKEINKLSNAFTVDLGQSVLKSAVDLSDFVGGADEVIKISQAAGPAVLGLAASFVTLRGSILATNAGALTLGRSLGLLSAIPLAAGLGNSIGSYIGEQLNEAQFVDLRRLERDNQSVVDALEKRLGTERDLISQSNRERLQAAGEVVRQLNRTYLADVDNAKSANDAFVKSSKDALKRVVDQRKKAIDQLRQAAESSVDIIEDSQRRIADLTADREDRQFSRSVAGFDDSAQAVKLAERAQQIAAEAAAKLANAVTPESIQEALKQFERARGLADQAGSLASGNRAAESRASAALDAIDSKQIAAEKELAKLQTERGPVLDEAIKKQERILGLLEKQVQIASESVSAFDGNSLFSDTDLALRGERLAGALDEIRSLSGIKLDIDTSKIFSDVKGAFEQLRGRTGFDLGGLEAFTGGKIGDPDQLLQAMNKVAERQAEIRSQIDAAAVADQKRVTLTAELDQLFTQLDSHEGSRNLFGGAEVGELQSQFQSISGFLERLRSDATLTVDEVNSLQPILQQFADNVANSNTPGQLGFRSTLNDLSEIFAKFGEVAQLPASNAVELKAELVGLDQLMSSTAGHAKSYADSLERAAAAASKRPDLGRAFGGVAYRAAGGVARGTDSVPAMLSPGEFVVNAASSRKFFSQLQAMNAGQTYRETGGTVINNSVGDLHIHAARDPESTGRAVLDKLNRELRRGTGRLR